jgi:hypothetical protein
MKTLQEIPVKRLINFFISLLFKNSCQIEKSRYNKDYSLCNRFHNSIPILERMRPMNSLFLSIHGNVFIECCFYRFVQSFVQLTETKNIHFWRGQ